MQARRGTRPRVEGGCPFSLSGIDMPTSPLIPCRKRKKTRAATEDGGTLLFHRLLSLCPFHRRVGGRLCY